MFSFSTRAILATVSLNGAHPCRITTPSSVDSAHTMSILSLRAYGANVDEIRADFGSAVTQAQLEQALSAKSYKLVTFTHVDTSTGAHIRYSSFMWH